MRLHPVFVALEPIADPDEVRVLQSFGQLLRAWDLDAEEAARLCESVGPAGVVTFSESMLPATARLAARLGLTHHDVAMIPSITQKAAQRDALVKAGLPCPAYSVVRSHGDAQACATHLQFPVVVKPLVGRGSRSTIRVATAAELPTAVTRLLEAGETELIVETEITADAVARPWGDYIAVDLLAGPDFAVPMFVTGKFALQRPYRERGGYGPAREDPAVLDEVCVTAAAAVAAVGIRNGVADVELKLTSQGPQIIEVNGRLGAWVDDLSLRTGGYDVVATALSDAVGDLAEPIPGPAASVDHIAYHYLLVPPPEVERVGNFAVLDALRREPGVLRVEKYKTERDCETPWRSGVGSFVGAVVGAGRNHADVVTSIERFEQMFSSMWMERLQ